MILFMFLYFGLIALCAGIYIFFTKEKKKKTISGITDVQEKLVLDRIAFYKEYNQHLIEVYNQGTISKQQQQKEQKLIVKEMKKLEKWLMEQNEQDSD